MARSTSGSKGKHRFEKYSLLLTQDRVWLTLLATFRTDAGCRSDVSLSRANVSTRTSQRTITTCHYVVVEKRRTLAHAAAMLNPRSTLGTTGRHVSP